MCGQSKIASRIFKQSELASQEDLQNEAVRKFLCNPKTMRINMKVNLTSPSEVLKNDIQ